MIMKLLVGTLLTIFLLLGNWQLHREHEKRTLIAAYQTALQAVPQAYQPGDNPKAYQRVRVSGTFLNGHTFLLDNQIVDHQPGYHVLTPLRVGRELLLVNRGWVPRQADRATLPTIPPVNGERSYVGLLVPMKSSAWNLGAIEDNPGRWPRVVETLDPQHLQTAVPMPLSPSVLRLEAGEPDGFHRDWSLQWLKPERHRAYAFQWFSAAAVSAVILLILIFRRGAYQ